MMEASQQCGLAERDWKAAHLFLNNKAVLTAAMFLFDTVHIWINLHAGKSSVICSNVICGHESLYSTQSQLICNRHSDINGRFAIWYKWFLLEMNFQLHLFQALLWSPSEPKGIVTCFSYLEWKIFLLSTHTYPTLQKFPDRWKCIKLSEMKLVLQRQQMQLLLISRTCSCLFYFL